MAAISNEFYNYDNQQRWSVGQYQQQQQSHHTVYNNPNLCRNNRQNSYPYSQSYPVPECAFNNYQQQSYIPIEIIPVQTPKFNDNSILRALLNNKSRRKIRFDPGYATKRQKIVELSAMISPRSAKLIEEFHTPPESPNRTTTNITINGSSEIDTTWFQSRNNFENAPTDKRLRQTYTRQQTLQLEKEFNCNQYLTKQRRMEISAELKLTDRQINTWFQNRRLKVKKDPAIMSPQKDFIESKFHQKPYHSHYTGNFAAAMVPNSYDYYHPQQQQHFANVHPIPATPTISINNNNDTSYQQSTNVFQP